MRSNSITVTVSIVDGGGETFKTVRVTRRRQFYLDTGHQGEGQREEDQDGGDAREDDGTGPWSGWIG